jgi:hypothetical protein
MEVGTMKMTLSRGIPLLLLAFLVAMPLAWVSEGHAQTAPKAGAPAAGGMQEIQGKIQSVDPSGRMLTLEDGTRLMIPPTVSVPQGALKEGVIVKASFEERAGQKVVTSLEVQK